MKFAGLTNKFFVDENGSQKENVPLSGDRVIDAVEPVERVMFDNCLRNIVGSWAGLGYERCRIWIFFHLLFQIPLEMELFF